MESNRADNRTRPSAPGSGNRKSENSIGKDRAAIPADGIVEQLWRSTAEMQRGYNSPVVRELIADEVNYLGHGSNYAILAQASLREAPQGNKLAIALRHGGDPALTDALVAHASDFCADMLRDDVVATIAKVNFLPVQPRTLDMFLHLYCEDSETASRAKQGHAFPAPRDEATIRKPHEKTQRRR